MQHENDLTSRAQEYASVQVMVGTVGWSDQEDHIFQKGIVGGKPGERHTLICVTLYAGKDPSEKSVVGEARGRKIVCALNALAGHRIPKKGTRAYVAIPAGMEENPGAAVIIATVEDDPERLEADRRVLDYGDEHIVIKGKSVSIQSNDNEFVSVGTPRSGGTSGVTIQAKDGTGAVWQVGVASMFVAAGGDAKTLIQLTPTAAEIVQKDTGFIILADGECHTYAPVNKMQGAGCYIGKAPTPTNFALWGPTGVAGVASASVFISPI